MGGGEESFGYLVELEPAPPQSGGIALKTLALVRTECPHVIVIVVVVVVEHYSF